MIPYSLHVALVLAVCFVFYKVLLQKETYYRLNRVILITCLALAFVLPLIPVPQQFSWLTSPAQTPVKIPAADEQANYQLPAEAPIALPQAPVKQAIPEKAVVKAPTKQSAIVAIAKPLVPSVPVMELIIKWALILYWCGVAAFGLNLLVQVVALLIQAYKKPAIHDGIYRIVELDTDKAPCSFGNNIFINPSKYDWETYNQILIHEKVHIQQGHSLDLLLAELMLVVQWFNPFAWLYRKELESNLEFLTDDEVLHHNEVEIADYQMSLLKVSVPNFSMRITTNYNQSLLKKRIVMMNAKKSNIHTMWKYFMLMPLLLALVCGLNKPIAAASQLAKFQQRNFERNSEKLDWSHGTWFATIKGDKIYIQFEADDNDEHHSWSSSRNFNLSDFPNLPKGDKADFTLTREAGAVVFNGRFDGDQGLGHYKFTPNKEYGEFMVKQNIAANDDDGYFNFFMANVKKEYVTFLKDNGFKDIPRNQVMSMSSQNIDAAYIKYWKDLGYSSLTPNELVSLKSQKIDAAYVNDIRKAGYTNLSVRELISFHSQGITGDYINGLKKANVALPGATAPADLTPREVITSKSMHVDSAYVSGMRNAGRGGDNFNQLTTLKMLNVTPEYVKSFEDVGFKDIAQSTLINMKREDITPEYVKSFKDMGYSDHDISNLVRMKREGITPEYVKSFTSVGYTSISVSTLARLASQKITPQDVKSYQDLGLKMDPSDVRRRQREMIAVRGVTVQQQDMASKQDIMADGSLSINAIASFKQQGITPDYVKGLKGTGYKDLTVNTIRQFKNDGVTPDNIKALQGLGYNDIPANAVKLVTPEYIKSFVGIGYKDVPLEQYANLQRMGVTADFVAGFNKLGFTNIPVNQLGYLKRSGITPEFVADMKQKGFDSKDINKYIQLKNFNSETGNMPGQKTRVMPATIINK